MKITAFNGSPRAKRSNTGIMVDEFLAGASKAGADTKQIYLSTKKIGSCMGCFKCWIHTPGKCIIKDDMTELLEEVITSDLIIMATPLYVDGVTGIMKHFMDRFIPLADPRFEKDENGGWRHKKRFTKYPDIMIISNCGMPGREHFQVLELHFRRMARNFHSSVIAEIYIDTGELLKNLIPLLKPVIPNYKKNLRNAGVEFVESGKISDKTSKKLSKPLLEEDMFIREANKYWDKQLKSIKSEENS